MPRSLTVTTVRTVQKRVKGVVFHSRTFREKDCIAVKTVSKRKPKRFIFVTSERVKNLVGLYGKILRKSEVANAQYQKYL